VRHLKATLVQVEISSHRQAILAGLPPGYVERVEGAYGGGWLPVEHDLLLARAIRAAMSPAEHHDFCVAAVTSSFDGPLLRALTQAGLSLLGRDLKRLASWVPKGWGLTFQHVGTWAVQPDPDRPEVHLALSGLPPACLEGDDWIQATASSLSAICTLAGVSGRVRVRAVDRPLGWVDYLLRWER
jgi:hypothetical protein